MHTPDLAPTGHKAEGKVKQKHGNIRTLTAPNMHLPQASNLTKKHLTYLTAAE